jgi:hypothetical protein
MLKGKSCGLFDYTRIAEGIRMEHFIPPCPRLPSTCVNNEVDRTHNLNPKKAITS